MTPAHTLVAQTCLGVLLHLDPNITRDSLTTFPLAKYAAEHWFEHARFEGVSQNADEGTKRLFDTMKPHFAIWIWICDPTVLPWNRRELSVYGGRREHLPDQRDLHQRASIAECVFAVASIKPKRHA